MHSHARFLVVFLIFLAPVLRAQDSSLPSRNLARNGAYIALGKIEGAATPLALRRPEAASR